MMNPPGISRNNQHRVSEPLIHHQNIDDDISDLLRDNFGPANSAEFAPKNDFSDLELDKNLSEIFEDLQKAIKSENGENNNSYGEPLIDDSIQSLLNIQNEIELEIEEERVEKLRNPRFQTLPAYQKRAKQESQWMEALNSAKIVPDSPRPHTATSVEVISIAEDEFVDVSTKVTSSTDLPCKSNILMSTEKHLTSSNHFPANSRIFNRSLEELQSTALAISQSYLAEREKETKKLKRAKEVRRGVKPYPAKSSHKRLKTDTMRSILIRNNNHVNTFSPPSREKEDVYNTVWVPALKERTKLTSLPLQHTAPPPVPPVIKPRNLPAPNVYKACRVPIAQAPIPVAPKQVKLPITGHQGSGTCLLLNMSSSKPVVLNKSQILQAVTARRPPAPPAGRSGQSCYNCERLSSCLPYLGYTMRRLSQGQGLLRRSSAGDSLVLLCEICGTFVRETVIYSEQMNLNHVPASCFPKFFNNSNIEIRQDEENQNYISN